MAFPSIDSLEISCEELQTLREGRESFRLVDCREADEWNICHLDGAVLTPLSNFGELAMQRFTDQAEHMVIYCHHGMRSASAAKFLRQKGHPHVWSLHGGIEEWACEIEPGMARY